MFQENIYNRLTELNGITGLKIQHLENFLKTCGNWDKEYNAEELLGN